MIMKLNLSLRLPRCGFCRRGFLPRRQATNDTVTSAPVYVPDTSHANEPLPDGVSRGTS
jgi:hypothetical protein